MSKTPVAIVVGAANVDIHGRALQSLTAGDSNPGSVHTSAGGVGRNIAENLARLGTDCHLLTAIGNDANGRWLLEQARTAGIVVDAVFATDAAPTSTYVAILDERGDLHTAINDMSVMDALTPAVLQRHRALLQSADLVVVDTNVRVDSLDWVTETCSGIPVFADTVAAAKAARIEPLLGRIHTLKTNRLELAALAGNADDLHAATGKLHAAGLERVFVTLGEDGVFYSTPEASGHAPVLERRDELRSTGGAGDTFVAALACAWLRGWSLDETLRFAQTSAGLALDEAAASSPALSVDRVRQAMEAQRG